MTWPQLVFWVVVALAVLAAGPAYAVYLNSKDAPPAPDVESEPL